MRELVDGAQAGVATRGPGRAPRQLRIGAGRGHGVEQGDAHRRDLALRLGPDVHPEIVDGRLGDRQVRTPAEVRAGTTDDGGDGAVLRVDEDASADHELVEQRRGGRAESLQPQVAVRGDARDDVSWGITPRNDEIVGMPTARRHPRVAEGIEVRIGRQAGAEVGIDRSGGESRRHRLLRLRDSAQREQQDEGDEPPAIHASLLAGLKGRRDVEQPLGAGTPFEPPEDPAPRHQPERARPRRRSPRVADPSSA
jgi:hypothetical protein